MEDLLQSLDNLKISAFSKVSRLSGDIHNVTLGPNANNTVIYDTYSTVDKKKESKKSPASAQRKPQEIASPNLNQLRKQLEVQRREKIEEEVKHRYNRFCEFSEMQRQQSRNQWCIQQQRVIQDMENRERRILQIMQQSHKTNTPTSNEELVKHYQELIQKKHHYKQQLEKNRQKHENIDKIKKIQLEFRTCYEEIRDLMKGCDINQLKAIMGNSITLLKLLPNTMEEVTIKCKHLQVDEEDVSKAMNVINQCRAFKKLIQDALAAIKRKQETEEASKKAAAEKIAAEHKETVVESSLDRFVSADNLKRYTELQHFTEQYTNRFKALAEDESLKQFRFDCKKAVNIPVNAISATNSAHLRDKYVKISSLLCGKNVSVADKQINASQHPQGLLFCTDLLARKFVLQGDLMISSNPEAAFCYATIIVTLWKDSPDFGKLLLNYFYTQCPYLIPFNIPKTGGQSDEDYYTSLGYRYTNGQIERQDKFLKRITGMFRLYFAITIAEPKGGGESPHNIRNAWNFLASLLKIEPKLDVTATALHIFLETIGFQMQAVYGRMFTKVVQIIERKFMPELKKIDTGGPGSRLEILLQDYKRNGFEKPKGLLSKNFW